MVDAQVSQFELELDDALFGRPLMKSGGTTAFVDAANLIDIAHKTRHDVSSRFTLGLRIYAPNLIDRGEGDRFELETLLADLDFGAHYGVLRDFLYYTYNRPNTIGWEFQQNEVRIKFIDGSLPRQFFIAENNWYLDSIHTFQGSHKRTKQIRRLLKGVPEFKETSKTISAERLIREEVDLKLGAYFNLVSDFSVSLESYTFADFVAVFRALLVKALYHRYYADVNKNAGGAVFLPLHTFAVTLSEDMGIALQTAKEILRDISYGEQARKIRIDPVYFSLYHLTISDTILMIPADFATWEGFVSFLRIIALRNPTLFLQRFSNQIGDGMTKRLASSIQVAGFGCQRNVSLSNFDRQLPDIDLLVISEERTLGYFILICEVKSPLPPMWAKDQLRVLRPDGLSKAFDQLDKIAEFFRTPLGKDFLRGHVPGKGLPDFDEFAILLRKLVITSDNAGAFFSDRDTTVVDFRTFERILRRCDGDMNYILAVLDGIPAWADSSYDLVNVEVPIGRKSVFYEGVKATALMDFHQAEYRSASVPEQLLEGFLDVGGRPLDVFRDRRDVKES